MSGELARTYNRRQGNRRETNKQSPRRCYHLSSTHNKYVKAQHNTKASKEQHTTAERETGVGGHTSNVLEVVVDIYHLCTTTESEHNAIQRQPKNSTTTDRETATLCRGNQRPRHNTKGQPQNGIKCLTETWTEAHQSVQVVE